jgi:hypothetical protein
VLNWSISRNHKEIWNSTKISVTPDVRDMRKQCAKATDPWAQGLAGQPNFESVQTKTSWTRVYTRREWLWRWRKSVEAELVGRPATTW